MLLQICLFCKGRDVSLVPKHACPHTCLNNLEFKSTNTIILHYNVCVYVLNSIVSDDIVVFSYLNT